MRKVLLTPELAQQYLDKNYENNRNINWTHVEKIASDIKRGSWNEDISQFNGAICIAKDGTMIDGQHRCWAVIHANEPINTWIQYDVPKETYEFLDCSLSRRTADFLKVPNANAICAIATRTYSIEKGKNGLTNSIRGVISFAQTNGKQHLVLPTRQHIIEYVNDNIEYLQMINSYSKKISKYIKSKGAVIAATLFLIDYVGKGDMLEEFVEDFSKIAPDSKAVSGARTYITSKISDKRYNSTNTWIVGCVLAAYEGFCNGKAVTSKYMAKQDYFYKRYETMMLNERRERKERGE